MITQIAILMILLQILIGCGEHLDVCNAGFLFLDIEDADWDEDGGFE